MFNKERYTINCCHNCENRKPGCHGSCEKYITERAEYEAQKAEAIRNANKGVDAQRNDSLYKATKYRTYRKKYR